MKKNIATITPVFNTQEYLHRCIKSLLGQKNITAQFIFVDDGSTDNSADIIQFYQKQDARIVFVQKANQGQGIARNIGIDIANAEYAYFVDSDDYLGDNTLSILYNSAKKHNLDICSPDVPDHYFNKALEYIPCLPCKSQFIKFDILKQYNIKQPDARSGQDGVFSHLVLTHCTRVGMDKNAIFYYTHAREGSTFTSYLKRHDIVLTLLQQHYAAIVSHYDEWDLWRQNSMRLLSFINDETLRNRLKPHFVHLSDEDKKQCVGLIAEIAQRAYENIPSQQHQYIGKYVRALLAHDVKSVVSLYDTLLEQQEERIDFPKAKNFVNAGVQICKYNDPELSPVSAEAQKDSVPAGKKDYSNNAEIGELVRIVKTLQSKLDYALNTINNSTMLLNASIRFPVPTLEGGEKDLVVSMTTLPSRLPMTHFAIESIFNQTIRPEKIILWISDAADLDTLLTPQLRALQERGLEINAVKDLGPHTKLFYALQQFPNKSIITFDDDIIYPINTIQFLYKQHTHYPEAVVGNWARELAFDKDGKVLGVRQGKLLTPPNLETEIEQNAYHGQPNIRAFPYGTSGVLYPPHALHERVFEVETFQKLCAKEDDIWFKAMSLLNRTPVVVTNLGINPGHHCVTGTQIVALRHHNHDLEQNKKQMRNVFDYFNLYDYLT